MAFVITSPCVGEKWAECVEVCPVDCIEEGASMYFINPSTCIDCGACMEACPSKAIFPVEQVPIREQVYIEFNKEYFSE